MSSPSKLNPTEDDSHHVGEAETVVKSGTALLLASLMGNGMNYAVGLLLARLLGAESFGTYALGLTIFNALVVVMLCGMHTGVLKFVSQYVGLRDIPMVRHTIVLVMGFSALSGVLAGVCLAATAPFIATDVYRNPELSSVLWLFSAALPLAGLGMVLLSTLQALQLVRSIILFKYLWEPLGKFLLTALFIWAGWGVHGAVLVLPLVFLVSILLCGKKVWRETGMTLGDLWSWEQGPRKPMLMFCLPLTFSNMFDAVAPRFDIFFLGYWGTIQEVGIYSAAFQTAAVLALVLGAFNQIFSPVIGRISLREEKEKARQLYQFACRMNLMVTMPLFLTLTVFSADILGWFGRVFSVAAPCLVVLALGQVVNSSSGFASTILLMSGHSRLVMTNTIVFGCLLIVLAALLIPAWGMLGAALAGSCSLILVSLVRVLQVWWIYHIHPYSHDLLKPIGAGFICLTVLVFLKDVTAPTLYPVLAGVGGCVYLGFLMALKLDPTDRHILGKVFDQVKRWRLFRAFEPCR